MEIDRKVIRWGGLSGILAFIVWIIEMQVYAYVDPFVAGGLERFPEVERMLAVSTILCMVTAFLSIALIVVLHKVIRKTNPALSLYGTVLSIVGFVGIALSDASTFYAFVPLSDLYHSSTASMQSRDTIVLLWESTQGVTYTFTFVGSLFLMIGFVAFGLVMRQDSDFTSRHGWATTLLGVVGGLGVVFSLFVFEAIGLMFIADLVFLVLNGRRLYQLSKKTVIEETL
jgi:hypothetical protein